MGIFSTTHREKNRFFNDDGCQKTADANIFKDILWIRSEKYEI